MIQFHKIKNTCVNILQQKIIYPDLIEIAIGFLSDGVYCLYLIA